MANDVHACAVVGKALERGDYGVKGILARAILRQPNLLVAMARTRQGKVASDVLLASSDENVRLQARTQLVAGCDSLLRTRYGRLTAAALEVNGVAADIGSEGVRRGSTSS